MPIFFITGTSGSGKTTLIKYLKSKLPKTLFEIYDFDEVGVPKNADKAWRLKTTDYWLTKAKKNSEEKKSSVICGVSVPSEILNSLKKPDLPIYFGFLKVSDDVIKKRLKDRGWDAQLIQDNINWAHYLENEVKIHKHHLIVQSDDNVPEKIADTFVAWILTRTIEKI